MRVRVVFSVLAIVLVATSIVVLLVPVHNDLQDCGVPIAYLVDGRVDAAAPDAGPDVTACSVLSGRRLGVGVGLIALGGLMAIGWAVVADRAEDDSWQELQQRRPAT